MNIQDALKETGKAHRDGGTVAYLKLDNLGAPQFYSKEDDSDWNSAPTLEAILGTNWQSYHEVKEIRPEYMGELWQYENECGEGKQTLVTIFKWEPTGGKLRLQYVDHTVSHIVGKLEWHKDIVHNKNGWTREYPPAEDI